jgi:hypothetical protein
MVVALKESKPDDWIDSFISLNMHPKHCLPFDDWLRKISSCIHTSDAAFKTELGSMTIFDAMPTFWRAWTPLFREEVIPKIDILAIQIWMRMSSESRKT